MDFAALTETDFNKNPVLFVELVRRWAEGGAEPQPHHVEWLRQMPRPLIALPATAREALWGILSCPERARALSWLDRAGILEEIIPSWAGDYFRQALRLQAVEEVHLEHWAEGFSEAAFDWLCVYQDQQVDGRLNGWALTGLATLLLAGDEPPFSYATRVTMDLKALGAKDGERDRIITAILEYPDFYDAIASCRPPARLFSPTTIIATLATLAVIPHVAEDICAHAKDFGNQILLRYAAPDAMK